VNGAVGQRHLVEVHAHMAVEVRVACQADRRDELVLTGLEREVERHHHPIVVGHQSAEVPIGDAHTQPGHVVEHGRADQVETGLAKLDRLAHGQRDPQRRVVEPADQAGKRRALGRELQVGGDAGSEETQRRRRRQ
jgi:hypothetical protein